MGTGPGSLRRTLCALVSIGLLVALGDSVTAHPLMSGAPDVREFVWSNPAVKPFRQNRSRGPVHLPIGVAGLLAARDRSPLYPVLGGDWSAIDLGKTLVQLRYPAMFVLAPPESPTELIVDVSASRLSFSGYELVGQSDPLPLAAWSPASRPWFVPLVRFTRPLLELDLGAALAAAYPRILATDTSFAPLGVAGATVDTYVDAAVAARTRVGVERALESGQALRAGLAIYLPVSVAHLYSHASVLATANEQALPDSVSYEWSAIAWYPGTGAGIGVRLDAGIALESTPWVFGLGIVSLVNSFGGFGIDLLADDARAKVTYPQGRPVPTFTVSLDSRVAGRGVSGALEAWIDQRIRARAGLRVDLGVTHLLAGIGWHGLPTGSLGVGFEFPNLTVESGVRLLEPPAEALSSGFPPIGVGVSLSHERGEP